MYDWIRILYWERGSILKVVFYIYFDFGVVVIMEVLREGVMDDEGGRCLLKIWWMRGKNVEYLSNKIYLLLLVFLWVWWFFVFFFLIYSIFLGKSLIVGNIVV